MSDTLFDKIVRGDIPNYTVWEDDDFLAFLTPFPGTPGMTVVIPKTNQGDDVNKLSPEQAAAMMVAVQKVAVQLERAFDDCHRVAVVFEGTGVAYVHAKLYPLHGALGGQTDVWTAHQEFYPEYLGYITTVEGPEMPAEKLQEIQARIRKAAA